MSSYNYAVGQDDDEVEIAETIRDINGVVVDLTGASVQLRIRDVDEVEDEILVTGALASAEDGTVTAELSAADTAVPGEYNVQWLYTLGGARVTYPPGGFLRLHIQRKA